MLRLSTIHIVVVLILLMNGESSQVKSTKQLKNRKHLCEKVAENLAKERKKVEKAMWDLQTDQEKFREELERVQRLVSVNDLIRLNVGGKFIVTRRNTLTKVSNSTLAQFFNPQSSSQLTPNRDGRIFFDYNSVIFIHLLNQLRMLQINDTPIFYPPLSLSLEKSFYQMLEDFGLIGPGKSENDVIEINVRGERFATLRKTLAASSDPKIARLALDLKEVKRDRLGRPYLDYDPNNFRHLLSLLRQGKKNINQPTLTTRKPTLSTKVNKGSKPTPSKQKFNGDRNKIQTTKPHTIRATTTVKQTFDSPSTHASLPEDYSTLIREETTSLAQDTAEKILETSTTDQESALLSTGQSVDSFSYLTDSTTQDDSLGITSLSEQQGQSITEETIISILEKEHEEVQSTSETITEPSNLSEISTIVSSSPDDNMEHQDSSVLLSTEAEIRDEATSPVSSTQKITVNQDSSSNSLLPTDVGDESTSLASSLGDDMINQDSPLPASTVTNAANEDSTLATIPGDDGANEDSTLATTPGDDGANEDSTLATTPADITANEDSTLVTTPTDDTANEDSTLATTPVDNTVNEDSTLVSTPGDDAVNEDATLVATPGDDAVNEDSTLVSTPGDDAVNEDSTLVSTPGDDAANEDSTSASSPEETTVNQDSSSNSVVPSNMGDESTSPDSSGKTDAANEATSPTAFSEGTDMYIQDPSPSTPVDTNARDQSTAAVSLEEDSTTYQDSSLLPSMEPNVKTEEISSAPSTELISTADYYSVTQDSNSDDFSTTVKIMTDTSLEMESDEMNNSPTESFTQRYSSLETTSNLVDNYIANSTIQSNEPTSIENLATLADEKTVQIDTSTSTIADLPMTPNNPSNEDDYSDAKEGQVLRSHSLFAGLNSDDVGEQDYDEH